MSFSAMLGTIYCFCSSFVCGGRRVTSLNVAFMPEPFEFYLCVVKQIHKVTLVCFVNCVKRKIVGFVF